MFHRGPALAAALVLASSCLAAAPAAIAAVPAATADEPTKNQTVTLAVERTKLANGLEVLIHEDKRAPVVTVNIWYHVGSREDPPGRSGFAHLFEHLMFQGSKHVPEDMYNRYLQGAGGSGINATTWFDRTNYFETMPKNRLEMALWLESDRMAYLLSHVDEKTFASQREVVKNEYRQRYENAPYGQTMNFISAALYPESHPYHRMGIGSPKELDASTLADVQSFFRTWYLPNNATIVLAGDIDKPKALGLIEKYFGPIPAGPQPPRAIAQPVVLTKEVRLDIQAGVELPRVTMAWATPARYAPGDAEMNVAAQVLTSGKSARLEKKLVHDLRIAQSVSAGSGIMARPLGTMFLISATPAPGHTSEEVIKAIDEELNALRTAPASDAELARAKTGIAADFTFKLDSTSARADLINEYNQDAGDPMFLARDMARHERVTGESLKEAVAAHLLPQKRVLAVVTPTKGAPTAGQLAGAK